MNRYYNKTPSKGHWIFEVALVLFLLHSVPVVGLFTPAALYAGIMVLLYACTFFQLGGRLFWRYFGRTIPLTIIIFLGFIRRLSSPDLSLLIEVYSYLQIVILLIIGQHVYNTNDIRLAKHLFILLLLMYVVTSITTYFGLQEHPEASRELATTIAVEDSVLYNVYRRLNIGGFSFIYILVLMIPLIVGVMKNRVLNIVVSVLAIIVFGAVIIESQYTTANIFAFFSMSLLLSTKQFDKRKSIVFLVVLIVLFILFRTFLSTYLSGLSETIDSELVASRLKDLSIVFTDGNKIGNISTKSDLDARYDLINISWNAFVSSPIFGTWNIQSQGGHSYFFDNLALYGLMGLVGFIALWYGFYKLYWKNNEKCHWFGYFLFAFFIALLLSVLNPHVFYNYLGLIVPVSIVLFRSKTP